MILSKSLKHGWYYYYKIHKDKLDGLPDAGYSDLAQFLLQARHQENRPDERFTDGPRGSQVSLDTDIEAAETQHIVSDLAQMGLESDFYKDKHMNVQMFMLAYDKETVAMEVPVWFEDPVGLSIPEIDALTGHIDLVRVEGDTVWIWDYKPDAHLETDATTQTFLYALMLSRRGNIDLANIQCGFFDEIRAYTFDPCSVLPNLE
jgi:hypothetical protein